MKKINTLKVSLILIISNLYLGCASFSSKSVDCLNSGDAYEETKSEALLDSMVDNCNHYLNVKYDASNDYSDSGDYDASKSLLVHSNLIKALLLKKENARAEVEIEKYILNVPDKPIISAPYYTVHLKADASRETIARLYVEMLKAKNKTTEAEEWAKKADLFNAQHLVVVENNKKLNVDIAKQKEKDEADRKRESINPTQSTNYTSSMGKSNESCTCSEREQYWVMGSSGSGLVKARPGRWEYREKQVPCPCK